jgi:ABC-type lipoprotein release transport system permease subunit
VAKSLSNYSLPIVIGMVVLIVIVSVVSGARQARTGSGPAR